MELLPKPLITIQLDKGLSDFGVYIYYKRDEPIYIGFGRKVIARVFDQHELDLIGLSDKVEIFPCSSLKHGLALERYLIVLHKPKLCGAKAWERYPLEECKRILIESQIEPSDGFIDPNPIAPAYRYYRDTREFPKPCT